MLFVYNCYIECVMVKFIKFFDDKVKVVRRMLFLCVFVFFKFLMNVCFVKM